MRFLILLCVLIFLLINVENTKGQPTDMRLVNGPHRCAGRLEVLHGGVWGTVCDDSWDLSDATVVCREMGCGDVIEETTEAYFGEGSGQIWLDEVGCTGTENGLKNCPANPWGTHNCEHSEDAGVVCQLDIRLVNGFNSCSGRVEVLHGGVWGTVCDDSWDLSDATVVCREMGCGAVIEEKTEAYYGEGSGQIWLDDVGCTGTENALKTCPANPWGTNNCGHSEDAGVLCLYGREPTTTVKTTTVDPCALLSCTEDEICGERHGVYGCFCNEDHYGCDFDQSVMCESSSGVISLSRCQLFEAGFSPETLHLYDPSCRATVQNGRVLFRFDNNEHTCGTSLVANGTHFIYENAILSEAHSNDKEAVISRNAFVNLHFRCTYHQTEALSMHMHPLGSIENRILQGVGTYQVRIVPYRTAAFSDPLTSCQDVKLNRPVFVEVSFDGVDSNQFASVIDSCWATPVNDQTSSIRLDLINEMCPADDTVEMLQNGVSTSSRFSFRMFMFKAHTSRIYLHCSVHLCLTATANCAERFCNVHHRREGRSVDFHDTASISLGPLVLPEDNSE